MVLESLVEGGIKGPALINLLGRPGSGKHFVVNHFILEGLRNDEACLYFCVDHSPHDVRSILNRYIEVERYESEGKLFFVDAYLGRLGEGREKYTVEDPYDLQFYFRMVQKLRGEKIDRLVFDSVNGVCMKEEPRSLRLIHKFDGLMGKNNSFGLFVIVEGGLTKEFEVTFSRIGSTTLYTYRKDNRKFVEVMRMMTPHAHPTAKVEIEKEDIRLQKLQ